MANAELASCLIYAQP